MTNPPESPADEPLFLSACRGLPTPRRPVWLMRQAGRILEPYRRLKEEKGSIEVMFQDPKTAADVTLMPVDMLGVDAAILFADIFTPVDPMGCPVKFDPGPVLGFPVRDAAAVEKLHLIDSFKDLAYVGEIIGRIRERLPAHVPLIGFAGSPLTLATYLAEGGGAREFTQFRRLLHHDPTTAQRLVEVLTEVTIDYLRMQVEAGAQALQLFDTWIGALSLRDFDAHALPCLRRIFDETRPLGVPMLYYANNASHLLPSLGQVGADVLSLDWRTELADADRALDGRFPLQGYLDPCALFAPPDAIEEEVIGLLQRTDEIRHLFNLGHGVQPDTPYASVERLEQVVQGYATPAGASGEADG
ncbi:MAG: uroporphyrinogen decarboxylase [Candidatus Latescibacterota bacterium]|nr:uroporphyrinogen decarboxylase [Candidatus Latescibacterota bacterium]